MLNQDENRKRVEEYEKERRWQEELQRGRIALLLCVPNTLWSISILFFVLMVFNSIAIFVFAMTSLNTRTGCAALVWLFATCACVYFELTTNLFG